MNLRGRFSNEEVSLQHRLQDFGRGQISTSALEEGFQTDEVFQLDEHLHVKNLSIH